MGSLRFRRSVKLAPGVRMSVSKTGLGVSAGGRGARYSVHTSGRKTRSVGIPGTGLSHVTTSTGGGRSSTTRSRSQPAAAGPAPIDVLPKPGWLSSKAEKKYHEGIHAYMAGDHARALAAMQECLAADPSAVSAHLVAALCIGKLDGSDADQLRHLEAVVTSETTLPDKLQFKYLPPQMVQLGMEGKITEHITAEVGFDSAGASMLLAEVYQEAGRLDEAIGLVQQLYEASPTAPGIRLSLADLLMADNDYDGVVEVAAGATNDSDAGAALLHQRGGALFALGHQAAALDAFKEALAKPSRDPELLKVIRYDRALAYEAAGQKGRAKQDLERLYGADPQYLDVRERLAALQ